MNFLYQLKRNRDALRAGIMWMKLNKHDQWTREKLADFQRKQLSSLVFYATRHSPFYKELYKNIRIEKAIVLGELPIIDKAIMMENFNRFVTDPRLKLMELLTHIRQLNSDEYYLGKYRVVTTSGSSGLKGVFVFNRKEWSTFIAGCSRVNSIMNIHLIRFPKRLKISWMIAGSPIHVSSRVTVSGQSPLVNTQQLSATSSIESQVNALNTFQP